MSIRWRVLILLLVISLGPLIIVSLLQLRSMQQLGDELAAETRRRVTQEARRHLEHLVADFTDTMKREGRAIELAVSIQAREVERLLAGDPPAARDIIDVASIDWSLATPTGTVPSKFHKRKIGEKLEPMPVAYDRQIYFIPKGVRKAEVQADIARLSGMTKVYELLHKDTAGQIYWQYTSLETGLHTSYPAHGPLKADYDPRERLWYRQTKRQHALRKDDEGEKAVVWSVPVVDVSSQVITVAACMPVHRPDGTFAGVTAIDMPITHIMEQLRLPEAWEADSRKLLVGVDPPPPYAKAVIFLQQSYQEKGCRWDKDIELEALKADDPKQLDAVVQDLRAGRSAVRRIRFEGRESFWGYGKKGDHPAVVVITPKENVLAPALAAQRHVLGRTRQALQIAAGILIAVLAVVVVAGLLRARAFTRPIRRLAAAASEIASGDFRTRVEIGGRDELHRLGEAFNAMSAGLAEREKLKASLAVAMEIQQHLLPQQEPKLEGFDIVGESHYCDETGGDYYDFIELVKLGPGKLGIALGDVAGHGISAALLMASARAVLRSHVGVHGEDLGRLFEDINVHLVRDTGEERFVTLFYGVLDGPTKTLYWSSAGHDPAMWVRRSTRAVEELPNTGIPLGVVEETSYERGGPVKMESGDVVVIGTDGIWEAANKTGELFGKARLEEIIKATAEMSAAEIRVAVIQAVRDFRDPMPQRDDITLVIIKAL
ncbi:MAG: SpoIIE family protein phosphatase [Planctomycetota bacterium]|jgi:sigma-B regulation protein RsbU (phosphoserine phosphatase)